MGALGVCKGEADGAGVSRCSPVSLWVLEGVVVGAQTELGISALSPALPPLSRWPWLD